VTLTGLVRAIAPRMTEPLEQLRAGRDGVITAPRPAHSLAAALLASQDGAGRPLLVITATGRQADDMAAELRGLIEGVSVEVYPSWETLPHERLSPSLDTVGRRTAVMRRLRRPDSSDPLAAPVQVVVASVRAVLQPISMSIAECDPVRVRTGMTIEPVQVARRLVELGYERVDLVERRGQFAVRGGIVDVFVPTDEHPVRIEFWDDTVESVRSFAVIDQRSLAECPDGLLAGPVRELLFTDAVRTRARALATQYPELADLAGRIAEAQITEGMEALIPALVEDLAPFTELLATNAAIVLCEPERVSARAADLVRTAEEFLVASWHNAAAGNVTPIDLSPIDLSSSSYLSVEEIRDATRGKHPWWEISALPGDSGDEEEPAPHGFPLGAAEWDLSTGDPHHRLGQIGELIRDGWAVVVTTAGQGSAARFAESMGAEEIPARVVEALPEPPEPRVVSVCAGPFERGYLLTDARVALLTEADLIGRRAGTRDVRRMPSRRKRTIDPLTLVPGDFVVHEQHGVGRYIEMVQRAVGGATREYLVLEYASSKRGQPPDRLYVPTDQLDLVTRYVGSEAPAVHRLGGADWQQAKGRARKAVRKIAEELIRLYAARQQAKGYAYGADTVWQRELEDAFAYIETPDQLSSIEEVKGDMERTTPMDRLICGDVGYGKTEIAVRAAFKAVQDGKQVAVLVPTTLLVQQHLATFSDRYAPFPVRVAALSRFSSAKEARQVMEGLKDGTVDVVIGTHRLLSPDVSFKDLGLVILDEEQRFGVEHKEFLKAVRTNVDVLAMSATPIPRTLEMAVTGIRDMSVIQTPPEERHPVLTFVGPYHDRQIAAAIRRELAREGQIFYVHNRVESIERVAARVRELVPEARVATAHGKMSEATLERVILDFWEKSIDVLICTTIVESGIDIPNANTLIVDRADALGLSQLHQLRGRVGRGRERAYAYFLYDEQRPMTETAHERLTTIAQHTDLGSGMHIALKDLEIRGAGNLLGGEQSGHIADVGFDLYVRLVGEALAEAKGEAPVAHEELKVELPINASIPVEYLPHERLRLEAYKRLADAVTEAAVDEVQAEFLDRYGPLPEPVQALLEIARFRVLARSAGLDEVIAAGPNIRLHPVELPESGQLRLRRLYPQTIVKPAVRTVLVPRPMTAPIGGQPIRDLELLAWVRDLIQTTLLEPVRAPSGD